MRTILLVLLLMLTVSATTPDSCIVGVKDQSKGVHIVVEKCENIGTFSLGGVYGGNWEKLTYSYPKSWPGTFLTIKVDDKLYANSHYTNTTHLDPYVISLPHRAGDVITSEWRLEENLLVEQTFEAFVNGTSIRIALTNEGLTTTTAGVRLHIDTMLGVNDGAPIYIPGDGLKTNEKIYTGNTLNFRYWKAYNSQDAPTIVATGTIDPDSGLSYPDKVILADWKKSKDSAWDYPATDRSILGDSAVILYYNDIVIGPGETKVITTNYGNEKPVLPVAKGGFGITEILADNVYGKYCPNETAKISVDVLATKKAVAGFVTLEVTAKDKIVFNKTKPTGKVFADSVNTVRFELEIPDKTASYTARATLFNETAEIDAIERKSFVSVELSKCYPQKRSLLWLMLPLLFIIIILILVVVTLIRKKGGEVLLTKVVGEGSVKVNVKNGTSNVLRDCILEDKIPVQAEIDVSTIGVIRKENKLVWDLGELEPGDGATLEYTVRGVNVLPQARFSWKDGFIVSK